MVLRQLECTSRATAKAHIFYDLCAIPHLTSVEASEFLQVFPVVFRFVAPDSSAWPHHDRASGK